MQHSPHCLGWNKSHSGFYEEAIKCDSVESFICALYSKQDSVSRETSLLLSLHLLTMQHYYLQLILPCVSLLFTATLFLRVAAMDEHYAACRICLKLCLLSSEQNWLACGLIRLFLCVLCLDPDLLASGLCRALIDGMYCKGFCDSPAEWSMDLGVILSFLKCDTVVPEWAERKKSI